MSRTWIKIYCDRWMKGTLRNETPTLRGVWIDLLTLAGSGGFGYDGEIKISEGIGLMDEQICRMFHVDMDTWQAAKARLVETDRIKIGSGNTIAVVNWKKYQSEYQRQRRYRVKSVTKSYRIAGHQGPQGSLEGDNAGAKKCNSLPESVTRTDLDLDVDLEEEVEVVGERRASRSSAPSAEATKEPTGIVFNFTKKVWEGITEEQKKFWSDVYPAVNVVNALKRMAAYFDANPTKRRTHYGAFINRWLRRDQDKGGDVRGVRPTARPDWMRRAKGEKE